jgi:hypothetical protein
MNKQTPTPYALEAVLKLAQGNLGVDFISLANEGRAAAQYLVERGMIHRTAGYAATPGATPSNWTYFVETDSFRTDTRLDAPTQAAKLADGSLDAAQIAALLRSRFPYMTDPYFDAVAVAAVVAHEVAQDQADAQTSAVFGFTNLIEFIKRDSARTRPAQPELAELCANPDSFRWVPGSNLMRITARNGDDASSANPA